MLLDESSGGFSVLVGGLPSISTNQRAQLRSDRGWFDCRQAGLFYLVKRKSPRQVGLEPEEGEPKAEPSHSILPFTLQPPFFATPFRGVTSLPRSGLDRNLANCCQC